MRVARGHEPFTYTLLVLLGIIVSSKFFIDYDMGMFLALVVVILFLIVFILFFHRDPDRQPPPLSDEYVVAPADGRVRAIVSERESSMIQIRMSVMNVHVNRMPISGTITNVQDHSGSHWPFFWFLTRGSDENARKVITIDSKHGRFQLIQISGFLARRCVLYHPVGSKVTRGERLGMIRFGSEVDLKFLFRNVEIEWLIRKGQTVKAGLTPIARLRPKNGEIT